MKLYRFDLDTSRPIERFGSEKAFVLPGARLPEGCSLHVMHLLPGGVVGLHPAAGDQLFIVLSGEGWVRGAQGAGVPIRAGQAAFWQAGEEHETRSAGGLAAVVIEGQQLDPAGWVPV